jgi:choline-sulfatase
MTDEQRYDQVGYASGGKWETPNMDALARQGVIFENAYCAAPLCIPSRGSMMTGLDPHRWPKSNETYGALQEGFWTVAHEFAKAGYETAWIGKMHFIPMHSKHGFQKRRSCEHQILVYDPEELSDYFRWLVTQGRADSKATHMFGDEPEDQEAYARWHEGILQVEPFEYPRQYHPTDFVTNETVRFLETRDNSRPFFLIVSFPHPHNPYDPPAPYDTMYDPENESVPQGEEKRNEGLPPLARKLLNEDAGQFYTPFRNVSPALFRKMKAYIRGLIRQIDDGIGTIARSINLDETVVFFTTDHGDYYGHRGLLGKVPLIPFEDLARVPFFCCGGSVKGGGVVTSPVQNHDFALTALELAGIEPPSAEFDTQSLVPILTSESPEKEADPEREVTCSTDSQYRMIRKGNLKYYRHATEREEFLIDVESDPLETRDCIGDAKYASAAGELREALDQHLAQGIPGLPRFDDAPVPAPLFTFKPKGLI